MAFPMLALGTWLLGGQKEADPHNDDAANKRIIRTAIDSGVRLIDTAQNYAAGKAESLVGDVLAEPKYRGRRIQVLGKHSRLKVDDEQQVQEEFNASLQRLGVPYFDYYLLHAPPLPGTSMEPFFTVANQLVRQGSIKHLGVSNFGPAFLRRAMELSESPLVVNQLSFSPTDRHIIDSGLYELCRDNDITIQAYRPLAESVGMMSNNKVARAIAQERGISIAQLAVAWICSNEGVALTVRASSAAHWQEIIEASEIILSEDEITTLMVTLPRQPSASAVILEGLQP